MILTRLIESNIIWQEQERKLKKLISVTLSKQQFQFRTLNKPINHY